MKKLIATVLILVLTLTVLPATTAEAATTYCTRAEFVKMVLDACDVEYTSSNYKQKAIDIGLCTTKTFSNYSWKTRKYDAAIILVRADAYLNKKSVTTAKAKEVMKGITDISAVNGTRGIYLAKAVWLGFMKGSANPQEEYPNAIKLSPTSCISMNTAKTLVKILVGTKARYIIPNPGYYRKPADNAATNEPIYVTPSPQKETAEVSIVWKGNTLTVGGKISDLVTIAGKADRIGEAEYTNWKWYTWNSDSANLLMALVDTDDKVQSIRAFGDAMAYGTKCGDKLPTIKSFVDMGFTHVLEEATVFYACREDEKHYKENWPMSQLEFDTYEMSDEYKGYLTAPKEFPSESVGLRYWKDVDEVFAIELNVSYTYSTIDTTYPKAAHSEYIEQSFDMYNAYRLLRGLNTFVKDDALMMISQNHAADMAEYNHIMHMDKDGTTFEQRLDSVGVFKYGAQENVQCGNFQSIHLFAMYLNSTEGHREPFVDASLTKIGIGCDYRGTGRYVYTTCVDFTVR